MPKTKPGEVHDKNGVPIYPGDLIKSFHFTDRNRKRWYLYHVAVWNAETENMEMVPTSHLEPSKVDGGGRCWLQQDYMGDAEVISGHGPGDYIDYTDRPKQAKRPSHPEPGL